MRKPKLLILAGTKAARQLVELLVTKTSFDITASLAGVTKQPKPLAAPTRIGGFGGAEGLASYLRENKIDAVIDATHPYAAQITANAVQACALCDIHLIQFQRSEWQSVLEDNWHFVSDLEHALSLIPEDKRVFFAASTKVAAPLALRPDLTYLIRSIEPPAPRDRLSNAIYVCGLPTAHWQDEAKLMQDHQIDWVISKNSGGTASYSKIHAARELGLPVAMLKRPKYSVRRAIGTSQEVLSVLRQHFTTALS
ncbi:cobalt-precorrin-6A reductase [Pseudovibrio sp. Tun.PSC04-5.I4]|uniref:cobalt-precorrin-6A reductase n=1 Tax=Pseudovibrio sp. Tun.PSC04-5.I4 TaxID=1798213 RepID=UPI000881D5ED|nr:cobalt-precorrin-6A reductase [Pseudovibrio sp. Tun.PSC04-5.I4]SDR21702.1 precorrin-6A reductase [Pseudovibrio sp. Tun.PSC04-5.I4]